jgi:hypothetical protein
MDMRIRDLMRGARTHPGARETDIDHLAREIGHDLPADYRDFLRWSDGAQGPVGSGAYVDLWSVDDVKSMRCISDTADVSEDLIEIGSDGSSTRYAIDLRSGEFLQLDMYGLGPERVDFRAPTLYELLLRRARD